MKKFTQAEAFEILQQTWCKECSTTLTLHADGSVMCGCESWEIDQININTGETTPIPACWKVPDELYDLMLHEGEKNDNS